METETPTNFSYMGRNFSDLSIDDSSSAFSDLSTDESSSAFSDCNSDRSGEFQTASSQSRRFFIACASDNSDDLIRQLVGVLETGSIEEQKQAAMEIRLLAKNTSENRLKIAKSGAIRPLISLLTSSDLQLQEYGVVAILNLSLCDENKELIASSGAIKPLVRALKTGTPTAKENAACALLRLSQIEENKVAIGRSGALPLLVNLLENDGIRGKKDASTALYALCSVKENKIRAVQAGIMKPLVELMADFGSNMVDKSAYVLSVLVSVPEARTALVEEGGIPVLVEMVEVGSQRQKEISVAILLQLCENNAVHCNMVAREGAIPPLVALSKTGTNRVKQKVAILLQLCKNNAVHRDMVAREGAIPPLVALSQLSQSGTIRAKAAKQKFRQNFGSNVMLSSSKMESLPGSLDTVDSFQVMKDANVEQMLGQVAEEHETLPHQLKRLFMYCSLFPFDYEFSKDELIQLWIAEGFIRERQMERMEDTASEYFNSLEKEGFFVYSRCDFAMEFDSLVWASANNPDNFLYKVNPIKRSLLEDTISSGIYFKAVDGKFDGASEMTRHLSLIDEDIDRMAFGVLQNFKHLRTLHMLSSHRSGSTMKQVPRDLCFTLTFLRTLNLSGTWISELPSSIGNVKSLRYVDASHTRIARLPESIDSLHNLQTIKLRDCTHFVKLPKGMKKLTNLRHIDLDITRQLDSMPAHLGNLTDLQTLSAFLVGRDHGCHVGELKNLNDLKGGLNISRLENVASKKEAEEAALIGKKRLHTLEFRWSDVFVEYAEQEEEILECLQPHYGLEVLHIHQYSGSLLPTWISNPAFADLVAITLYKCRNCKLLPCMGQLPALKSLYIIEMNEVKYIDHQFLRNGSGECAFPKLERLEVDIMLNLKEWKHIQVGDFPSLVKLIVDSCPELVRLAPLACLQSLKHLELRRCPKLLTLPSDGRLPHSLDSFLLVDCFELKEWCLKSEHWSTLCHISSIWFDHDEVGGEGEMLEGRSCLLSTAQPSSCDIMETAQPSSCEQSEDESNQDGAASSDSNSLIHRLGRDNSIGCLIHCSRSDYGSIASLNKSFWSVVRTGELYKLRRQNDVIEHWIYFSCHLLEWEAFDPNRGKWMHLPRMTSNECFMCSDKESLAVGTELLVFGKEVTAHVIFRYSILTNSWSTGMRMNAPRCLFGSASLKEIAILAGGCDSQGKILSSAELYNSETQTWELLPDMNNPRKMCSGVFMDKKFYVIGGIGGSDSKVLTCGEEYDLKTKKWTEIPNMSPGRSGAAKKTGVPATAEAPPLVAVVNSDLYAADYAGMEVRKYDKGRRLWITEGRLPERAVSMNGWGLAFRACGDRLILIGGHRNLGEGFIEINAWVPSEGPPQWNLLGKKRSGNFVYNSAVMGC